MHSYSIMKLTFYSFRLVKILIFVEKTWSRHLILFYLFKGKQNKKENPKCGFLFGKDSLWKTKVRSGGRVTYWEGTVKRP